MEYLKQSVCGRNLTCSGGVNESTVVSVYENSSSIPDGVMPVIPLYIHILFSILYSVLFVVGISGNMFVIYVIVRSKPMHNPTNYLLLNLALSDFLVILICLPTAFVDMFAKDVWYFGGFMCHLVNFLENTTVVSSVLNITAICIERFCAICRKMAVPSSTSVVVASLWLISLIVCTPFLKMAKYKDSEHLDGTPIKVCRVYTTGMGRRVYLTSFSVLFYVLPCLTLILLYYFIINHVTKETMAVNNEDQLTASRKTSLIKRRQAIYMLRMITFLCFICLLPFHGLRVLLLYINIYPNFTLEAYMLVLNTSRVAFYINSTINPLIYNIFSSKFRAAFRNALGCPTSPVQSRKFSRMTLTTV